jgi:hypothetical protein
VTLDAADTTLDYPQPAQLSGRVTGAGGVAIPGAPVSIQVATTRGFVTLLHAVSAADGAWSASLATQYTRTLRASASLPDGGHVSSAPAVVGVAPRIGAQTAATRVAVRRAFTVRASIRPRRAALVLVVARKGSDGAFHRVARLAMRARAGTARVLVRLRHPGLYRLLVQSLADERNVAGRSRDVLVRAVRARG